MLCGLLFRIPREQRLLRRVAQVLVHPGYSSKSLINDVAVLIVDPPFMFVCGPGHGSSRVLIGGPHEDYQQETAGGHQDYVSIEECEHL